MSESLGIDSPVRRWAMPKSYSSDLRERVIEAVEMGASRHEAAERFDVSVSSAVKWLQRWRESRSAAPKPRGGSVSPLERRAEAHRLRRVSEHGRRIAQCRAATDRRQRALMVSVSFARRRYRAGGEMDLTARARTEYATVPWKSERSPPQPRSR